MTGDLLSIRAQLSELRQQLAKLESLRALLGDELTDQKAQLLEAQVRTLAETSGGAFLAGDVQVRQGDFVARDKWQLWVDKVYLGCSQDQVPPEELLQAYQRALAMECSRLPLGVVDPRFLQTDVRTPVSLSHIYVDLDVMAAVREEQEKGGALLPGRLLRGAGGERTPLLEAIALPEVTRFVLLGDPGSGKTTFVHYLVFALANSKSAQEGSPLLPEGSLLQGLLPVRLVLREVAARCIPLDAPLGEAAMLWRALHTDLAAHLGDKAADRLLPYVQDRLLREGGLLLLDGLDEVPEANRRRRCLLEAVADLAAALPPERCRLVVTARPYAYADPRWHLSGFHTLVLAPFDDGQVARFIARWHQAVGPVMGWDEATAQGRGERLKQALDDRPYLADLATRPLLLTLMATLHTSWGQLPEDRAELYEETVKLLLSRWQRAREIQGPDGETLSEPGIARALSVAEDLVRTALHRLAFQAHEHQASGTDREEVPADISQGEVLAAFAPLLPDDFNPQVLLTYLETRAGLLVGRAPGSYAFPHRSFQEYLAACYLADGQEFAAELRDRVWHDPDWWRAVFLLGVGKAKQGGLSNAVHVVNTLVPEGPEEVSHPELAHWQAAILAGRALLDLRFPAASRGQPQFEAVLRRLRRWLVALMEEPEALVPRERAEAGDVLGKLGDPRPGVGVVPASPAERKTERGGEDLTDLLWCEVPAGPFLMGSSGDEPDAHGDETPQHRVNLPAFLISRYPITNAQYRPFVDGNGYDESRYWTPEGWAWRTGQREPDLSPLRDMQDEEWKRSYAGWLARRTVDRRDRPFWWADPHWGLANRPVVGVCWYEAVAFCHWLTEGMRRAGVKGQVWRSGRISALQSPLSNLRLPSEAEWEKAARGSQGSRWPWGDEWLANRANTEESGIKETSAVGAFPAGASFWGALDLAGNVWEWTASRWGRTSIYRPDYGYPYDPEDGREELDGADFRVVRGGSWNYDQGYARCAYRCWFAPGFYDFDAGFRVVVSLASSAF